MLELIKKLSNTQVDDEVIDFYIANAKQAIKSYLNDNKIDVVALYRNEVVELSCYYINKATMSQDSVENGAIKSISSAVRSVTFMDFDELNKIGIPQSIKDRLPKPKVTVKVW
ncbi:phage head-tail connector protein [Turicibacter sanguinis]|uniref:phage head-tail connector protein n=1 Tax=Turicibacter sanguinis TaxID=154288 RepID=UPI00232E35A9|nr:phage head-tail connector protein [Turicibacter sanguinis]MDB8574975.1 phage head-tail connector protein [Turicibacter sanguinis]MDB8578142.1 phage head-tail connector protein [Turicibacter sanguinis]MDB8583618.1 phage head-tail connector protein [Turicibacter sanguinis]MDB8586630.1 phage head-tail connector protein [Turicibacter sanguinis]MDB8597248.1 phage head-tail connector protein [Turicibacter sanguinis]